MVKPTTRDRILEKTSQLIREQGYQNIPLRQLTGLLGVTTGAFYKAFKDKDDLYYQTCMLESQRQAERWEAAYLDKVGSPLDGIWSIGRFLLSEYETDTHMMEFLFFNPVAVKAYREGVKLAIGDRTAAYIAALPIADPDEQRRLLLKLDAFITGYGYFIARGLERFDEAVYQSAFDDMLGGYRHDTDTDYLCPPL